MTGWTSNSPVGESPADAALGLPPPAGLAGLVRGGHRVRLPVLYRAGPVAARQEHQDVAGERADLPLAKRGSRCADKLFAATGFVGAGRAVAPGEGHRAVPAGRAGAGPASGDRRRPGVRGAGAVRCRRRPHRAGRPRVRTTGAGLAGADHSPTAEPDRDDHAATARRRAGGAGQGPVPSGRRATGVFDQHGAGSGAYRRLARRLLPATGRWSARRFGRHRSAPPGRRTVPVVRHPVDRVRDPPPDPSGVFPGVRDPPAPPREGSGPSSGRQPKSRCTTHYRREARRPLRPAALIATARTAARARTARDSRTARTRSETSGARPSPSVGRISSWWAYCVGPPSRTPNAP